MELLNSLETGSFQFESVNLIQLLVFYCIIIHFMIAYASNLHILVIFYAYYVRSNVLYLRENYSPQHAKRQ